MILLTMELNSICCLPSNLLEDSIKTVSPLTKSFAVFNIPIDLPFNEAGGRGPTLNATTYMRYGKVSATIKTAGTGGSVTAFILLADGGDEIDFEFLGGDVRNVQ